MCLSLLYSSHSIAEIDVRFTNDTPLVVVGSVYAQFEINRNDADIDCIVTGFARSKCKSVSRLKLTIIIISR